MPIGSMSSKENVPRIEDLMIERRKFDVSAEAFLIRVVKTAIRPIGMFCASPMSEDSNREYRVDYFVPSLTAPMVKLTGQTIPKDSIVSLCTAIGYTDHGNEDWVTGHSLDIECVGIPGYPDSLFPRVAGLIRFTSKRSDRHPIRFVHGNALEPRGENTRLVCQLVNDRARKWGGGIARKTARKFPQAQGEFAGWISGVPADSRLGSVHFSTEHDGIIIASLIAQAGFGVSDSPRIRYSALEKCLKTVAEFAQQERASIHMPRIGTGAAGASWDAVEEIIDYCIIRAGLSVTVYDLPPKRAQLELFV